MKLNDAIIYRGKDKTVILTREDFENEEEFEKWLHWMRENASSKGLGRSVRLWEDMSLVADLSEAETPRDEDEQHLWRIARQNLSQTQYRRLNMYIMDEMTLQEIADKEGVCFQAVHKSIVGAKRKLRRILERKRNRR